MDEMDALRHWVDLINRRGIAGAGARETALEKQIVERSTIDEFANTLRTLRFLEVDHVRPESPPLPDFSVRVSGRLLRVELVEFIDPELLKRAKQIRRTPDHALNHPDAFGLWFEPDRKWFLNLLSGIIQKKDLRYRDRDPKIDLLLVWNEAIQIGIEDSGRWISEFSPPELPGIESIYFQSWYDPHYVARPTWSVKAHPIIGEIAPVMSDLER